MRESDPKARIVFVSSRGRIDLAEDAAYSAGAVGVLMTPFTESSIEESWSSWMGKIPEAPGLTDLDALYPTLEDPEPAPPALPPLPGMPPLPGDPAPPVENIELPPLQPSEPAPITPPTKKKPKGRWIIRLFLLLIISGGAIGGAHYAGILDLNSLIDQLTGMV